MSLTFKNEEGESIVADDIDKATVRVYIFVNALIYLHIYFYTIYLRKFLSPELIHLHIICVNIHIDIHKHVYMRMYVYKVRK